MSVKLPEIPAAIEEADDVIKYMRGNTEALEGVSKALDDANERVSKLDKALGEANAQIDQLRERKPAPPLDAKNQEIVRRYTAPNADGVQPLVSSREAGPSIERKSRPYLGTNVGVVKFYGGYEEPGNSASWSPGLLDSEPVNDWHEELQRKAELVSVCKQFGHSGRDSMANRALVRHLALGPGMIGKMFSENAGEGAELIPESTTPVLEREAAEMRRVASLFSTRLVGPGGVKKNPFQTYGSGQAFRRGAVAAGSDAINALRASSINLTTSETDVPTLVGLFLAQAEAEEDAIIEWWPEARMTAVMTLVDSEEDATINGASAATMADGAALLDSALATWDGGGRWGVLDSDDDHRLAYDGLRRVAASLSSEADVSSAATAKDAFDDASRLDVPYRGRELVMLTSSKYQRALMVDSDIWTRDKSGEIATRFTGALGTLGNYPLMTSQFVSEELSTGGRYTGSGAKTERLIFDPSQFEYVQRRGLTITLGSIAHAMTGYMVFSQRRGFRFKIPTGAGNRKAIFAGYNL